MNARVWKRIAIAGGLIIAVVFTVEIILAGRDVPQIPPITQPIKCTTGFFAGIRGNNKSWTLDYKHCQLSPDGTYGMLDGVHDGVLYRKGKPYVKIAAEHLQLNTQTLDFTATGRVHVERIQSSQAETFDTDLIVWTNNAKLLRLDHSSFMRTSGRVLKLGPSTIDVQKNEMHLGAISGEINVPQK